MALALTRGDLADYVNALFIVYVILIFIRIVASFVPRMPYNPYLRAVLDFAQEVTDPYLNFFRRLIPLDRGRWRLRARPQPDDRAAGPLRRPASCSST